VNPRPSVALLVYGLDRPLAGISRYTRELVEALAMLPDSADLVLLDTGNSEALANANGLRRISLHGCNRLPGLITLGSVLIPLWIQHSRCHIIHDPTGVTPFLFGAGPAHTVVTIHDTFA